MRGICQGDPLSCLLFDLAIELLAASYKTPKPYKKSSSPNGASISGAKFNLEKTEVIPIGTKSHQDHIVTSRKIHADDTPLHEGICIASDSQAVHCLDAWIENDINNATPWETVLDKIKQHLCYELVRESHHKA
ncbi:hypothetical protein J3R82DRAFT_9191 [Butyriboletus roseoflavus]|nr:hypothetical protein J3R82DRAFT_9191 [Butyriboletus roseoflavus]